jgi:hypothetical protein
MHHCIGGEVTVGLKMPQRDNRLIFNMSRDDTLSLAINPLVIGFFDLGIRPSGLTGHDSHSRQTAFAMPRRYRRANRMD